VLPSSAECIAKTGIVERIDNDRIYVTITAVSACASCQVNGYCNSGDTSAKVIEIPRAEAPEVKPGQFVNVSMKASNGNLAVFFGYVLPLLILIASLLILINFTTEGFAGLLSLAMLIPYYAGLYAFRKHLDRRFRFSVEP
jgi:sigma-E factor negative regulatory protein RseC